LDGTIHGLLLFLTAIVADTAWACSCQEIEGPLLGLEVARSVFLGQVEGVSEFEKEEGYLDVVRFRVSKRWKGAVTSQTVLILEGGCSPRFVVGTEYLVFTSNYGTFPTPTICLPNAVTSLPAYGSFKVADDGFRRALGEGRSPIPLWPIPLLLVLALMVAGALRLWRIRKRPKAI
jgi:hypothetical protein